MWVTLTLGIARSLRQVRLPCRVAPRTLAAVLAEAVWRLYGVSAFEPTSRSGGGVGRKRRRSEVAGGVGEGAVGGGSGRRRVGS
jgi:hypothetical protein